MHCRALSAKTNHTDDEHTPTKTYKHAFWTMQHDRVIGQSFLNADPYFFLIMGPAIFPNGTHVCAVGKYGLGGG